MSDKKLDVKKLKAEVAQRELDEAVSTHVEPKMQATLEAQIEQVESELAETNGICLKNTSFNRYTNNEIAEIEKLIVEGKLPNKRFQEYKGWLCLVDKEDQTPGFGDGAVAQLTLRNGEMGPAQKVGAF